jgi:hypothetical protein
MAPYVGHPIEGSVFGYIERQNDPPYRLVQWGDGRDYWVSMLKSMAYSAVWHTQWKIGPASEASIGNVMLHASPGFITLVDTPTLGFCTMMAEDAESHFESRPDHADPEFFESGSHVCEHDGVPSAVGSFHADGPVRREPRNARGMGE